MPTAKLHVRGLRGAEDEEQVRHALRGIPGVYAAQVNRRDECAEVDYEDDEAALDTLLETVRRLGFDVNLAG